MWNWAFIERLKELQVVRAELNSELNDELKTIETPQS